MGCGADREGKPAGMDGSRGQTCEGAVSTCPDRVLCAAETCASHTGMEKPPLTRCQSSSELRNMWAFLAGRDFATDPSAAGIQAQAGRGKGNGETTAQQSQLGVTRTSHVPKGFGKDNDSPQTAAEAARKGRSRGGREDDDAGRSKESRGSKRETR